MVLIVMSHCDDIFGLANLYNATVGINKIITDWFDIGGQIGVGCFVLIFGYFMVEKHITVKKILRLVGEVWFYSIGIWAIWSICELYKHNMNWIDCLKEAKYAFFPILTSHYWFVTAYLILMILSPFFNKLVFSLNQTEYKCLLISVTMIFVILEGGFPNVFPGMSDGRLMPVFLMYLIAGYIKRFRKAKKNNARKHWMVAFAFYLLLFASFYFITLLGIKSNNQFLLADRYFYRELNSPLTVVICIEMFIAIIETDISYNRLINTIAGCTFGVYLIHSNRWMLGILSKLFPIYEEKRSLYIFLYSVLAFLIIYAFCTIIDLIRIKTFGKLWDRFLNKYLNTIQTKVLSTIKTMSVKCKRTLITFYEGNPYEGNSKKY